MSDIVEPLRSIEWTEAERLQVMAHVRQQDAEIERLRAALEKVLVGGNHLATIIGATHPQAGCHPEGALQFYGPGHQYDAWCCWNAIMQARAALGERTQETDA